MINDRPSYVGRVKKQPPVKQSTVFSLATHAAAAAAAAAVAVAVAPKAAANGSFSAQS